MAPRDVGTNIHSPRQGTDDGAKSRCPAVHLGESVSCIRIGYRTIDEGLLIGVNKDQRPPQDGIQLTKAKLLECSNQPTGSSTGHTMSFAGVSVALGLLPSS